MSRANGERGLQWLNQRVSPAAWNRRYDEIIRKALSDSGRMTRYDLR